MKKRKYRFSHIFGIFCKINISVNYYYIYLFDEIAPLHELFCFIYYVVKTSILNIRKFCF